MKTFKRVLGGIAVLSLLLSLAGPITVFALATTPNLGAATSYAILASSFINTFAGTTVNGDVGFTTGPQVRPAGIQLRYGSGAPYSTAGTDEGTALTNLAAQTPCDWTFAPGAVDLTTSIEAHPGSLGVYPPGIYCTSGSGAMNVSGTLTLNGAGTYIFRAVGALTSTSSAIVNLVGTSPCNVFWTATSATTLNANTTFQGTVIDDSGITVLANSNWTGRALAFGGTVTTGDTAHITVPATCAGTPPAIPASTGSPNGTLTVVKTVINDSGGTKTIASFPLFVNSTLVASGQSNNFPFSSIPYTVTETGDSGYAHSFSGDCDSTGHVILNSGDNKFCLIMNNDIGAVTTPLVPPLINVVKTASPLSLPAGPGPVVYTYTLTNIGTVPVTNITIVGDTCSPIILSSGDTNGDSKLDVNETWVYHCSWNLTQTHTNTVVATGWANGISAVAIASATVVVGVPVVPPLIHVTKIPSPLTLGAGGGMVTYTKRVTNPGTVPLSNIRLTDDKCGPVTYVSGDTNGNSLLDPTETWLYTCQTRLTQTTTNTVTAAGDANGLTARALAIATVVVASPKLPNTGIGPAEKNIPWSIVVLFGIFAASILFYIARRKQTT